MSIDEKKQALSQGQNVRPDKAPPPSQPKIEKPDTTVFGGKEHLPMSEALWKLKQASPYIPDSGGAMYSQQEREAMTKDWQNKYGSYLEKKDIPRIFKDLNAAKNQAPTGEERQRIDRQIRYFKREIMGK